MSATVDQNAVIESSADSAHITPSSRRIGTYLAYAFLFLTYVRPQELIPGLGALRLSGIVALALILWGVLHFRFRHLKSPLFLLILLGLLFAVCGIGALNVAPYKLAVKYMLEYFPQCLALYLLFDTRTRIQRLLFLWCVIYISMAVITLKNGGKGPGDFALDENDTALALSMGFPFLFYSLKILALSGWQRLLIWAGVFLCLAAIVTTNSRGGFLGIVAVLLTMWWFSKYRLRIAIIGLCSSLFFGGALLAIVPDHYLAEVYSIGDKENSTRVERLRSWDVAWLMYKDNLVFGVGPGNYPFNAATYQRQTDWWGMVSQRTLQGRVTHSLYFQLISEVGTVGILLYFYILILAPLKLYRKRNLAFRESDDELLKLFPQILIAGFAGFLISGTFISVGYYIHIPIWITLYAIYSRYHSECSDPVNEISTHKAVVV